ncbi:hypothetical protein M501DRAFT_1001470 [Patellaria atrata CBS 101060]|uniref:Uncharacterized protein n=1 Tax=Patellaria atrata CBS 101060 TaxID=1346257 RepID=A0A9P4S228_9PEZI|nr:hypothetical protein M501DRAFT_1001470 [Patellaria atrata CBS 101060]
MAVAAIITAFLAAPVFSRNIYKRANTSNTYNYVDPMIGTLDGGPYVFFGLF